MQISECRTPVNADFRMQNAECEIRMLPPGSMERLKQALRFISALVLCAERRELYTFKILNSTFKIPPFLPRMGLRKNNQS